MTVSLCDEKSDHKKSKSFRDEKVLGGFEPPSLDSESRVLTVTPQDLGCTTSTILRVILDDHDITPDEMKMTAVGFEPTRIAPPELESGALDRSAKLSSTGQNKCFARNSRARCLQSSTKNEARAIRTPNRLIWSQTRYRCAIAPQCCSPEL